MRRLPWAILVLIVFALATVLHSPGPEANAEPPPGTAPAGPLTPREELATFQVPKGFRVDLVASEPEVVDPVAMAFDEDGRLFVAEMRGYPNGGVATGNITSGRVVCLEDRDGDGVYEHSTVLVDGLRFPTSVMPWKGGLLVANAPDLLYLEGTDGDGKAARKRALYTGFGLKNIQQLVNSLQWGLDNWVYGCCGSDAGTIASPEKPDMPPLTLHSRGIRFHPETPGSLEPMSGGGQYGMAPDEGQHWFTATNSQHLRHIVLPDHYLRRNPALPVPAVTLDIPDHGAACKVFRISPFEAWRVERTKRRKEGPDAQRFPSTELVPGGYITSACSPVVYAAALFPEAYRGNTFVCDPANNLIHRDVLVPSAATYVARRAPEEANSEFLASTDTWFRPVHLSIGPEGALYVLDFYREVIETPLSLPDDIKQKLNLESRGRGRIWRVVPDSLPKERKPSARLRRETSNALARDLCSDNLWLRLTAQRLLVERQDQAVVELLRHLARAERQLPGQIHALWTLDGLKELDDATLLRALHSVATEVTEQAVRLAESRLASAAAVREAVARLADDPSPRVRFQVACSAGAADAPELTAALARVLLQDGADPWTQTAALSSAARNAPALLEALVEDRRDRARPEILTRLASLVAAPATEGDLARVIDLATKLGKERASGQAALLEGLGQGLQGRGRSLSRLLEQPPEALREAVERARPVFAEAATTARDGKRTVEGRTASIRLLGHAPFALASGPLQELLAPQQPGEIQLAAVRALALHDQPPVADLLLIGWTGYSPAVRREVVEALFRRGDRLEKLLTAIEEKKVPPNQLEPARLEQLRKYPEAKLRQRAQALLAGLVAPDRKKVIEDFQTALELKADAQHGKAVFKKTCSTCHRLENEGVEVGPDLLSALRNKSREQLLIDILDPSREVDPRYLNYQVMDKAGRSFTGMIAAETASSITLRRAEKAEDVILRDKIDTIEATAKSVMPDGLEMQLSKQDLADLIAYLQAVAVPR
jgi:putative membrane-bound dehydrogenase-like protein